MPKRTRNAGVPVVRQLSPRRAQLRYLHSRQFAPITGAGREPLSCFFRGLSFDAPWLRARHVHGGVERQQP